MPFSTVFQLYCSGKCTYLCFTGVLLTLPNDKILDVTKLKGFADEINVAQMMISVFDMVENIVGKGENPGYQHFLLFPQCFQKASFFGSSKSRVCGKELTSALHNILSKPLLLSHITIVETTDSGERAMNPVAMIIINPWKEYWLSQGSN